MKSISRTAARNIALPLAQSAIRNFDVPAVREAADAVVAAAQAVEDSVGLSRGNRGDWFDEAGMLRDLERRLDQRVKALNDALEAMGVLGHAGAEAVHAQVFTVNVRDLTRPKGRAQAREYVQIVEAIRAANPDDVPADLLPHMVSLADDLESFANRVVEKDVLVEGTGKAVDTAQEATDALRAALAALAWQVQVAAGGGNTEAYKAWRKTGEGLV